MRRYRKIRDLSLPLLAVLRTSATSPIPWGHGFAQNRVNCIFPSTNQSRLIAINPFVPSAPSLHPLKTSENRKVFWCFQGVEEGCIENEWVKQFNDLNWSWNCKRTRIKVPWSDHSLVYSYQRQLNWIDISAVHFQSSFTWYTQIWSLEK